MQAAAPYTDHEYDADPVVVVRLTDSIRRTGTLLDVLRRDAATIRFASLASAQAFENHLNRHDDDWTYHLTPDHSGDATFYLRCEES